ncbi:MAG TPA: DUF3089 domain-containing protein, partial [Methanocorpusculum sp.]|nr:DUF3089 domain-containing protein [Methanocorpusculum sp.]
AEPEPAEPSAALTITPEELAAAAAIHNNYSDKNNWMYYPETHEHAVDTFFLYPTASPDNTTSFFSSIDDAGMRSTAHKQYVDDGSEFESCTDVYAPYYRQVSPTALAGCSAEEFATYVGTIPKQDAFDALDYYFEHANKGGERPFILAAYSQGSFTTRYILAEYMKEHPEYYKNMVAAYVIGCPITEEFLAENPHLKFTTGETDTGVIISYTAEEPGATITDGSFVWDENMKVINPLNWKTDDTYAGADENLGAMITSENGTQSLGKGTADAQIDPTRKVVICTTVKSLFEGAGDTLVGQIFGEQSMHLQEAAMYYMNLRDNAEKRIAAFLAE